MAVLDPDNLFMALLVLAVAAVGGATVRATERWQRRAQDRADRRAAELDAAAEAAVRAERLAVARELHDLVSHAVGVMVMQAGAALARARAIRSGPAARSTSSAGPRPRPWTSSTGWSTCSAHGVLGAEVPGPTGTTWPR